MGFLMEENIGFAFFKNDNVDKRIPMARRISRSVYSDPETP